MSKYYKVEDVINTLADQWHFEATMEYPDTAGDIEEWKENARELFADLPTIEVSVEELRKKYKDFYEQGKFDAMLEVSEDCISREWVRENMLKYGFLAPDMTVTEFIEDAPSVVPTTEQSSMVGEWKREVNEKLGKCLRVVYVCSACGCAVGCENFVRRSYCPNCGAKMRLE